jgi:aryl-alcohol dehydrogenase-like predicted oxidoreductase
MVASTTALKTIVLAAIHCCVHCLLQVCYSVIDRRPSLFMSRFCEDRGISLLSYGTLAGGLLADRYRDVPASK